MHLNPFQIVPGSEPPGFIDRALGPLIELALGCLYVLIAVMLAAQVVREKL